MINKWCALFDAPKFYTYWSNIFTNKIKAMYYKKFAEFNFKILHNILPCGYLVNKWNKKVKSDCMLCNEPQTTKHLLFNCKNVGLVWKNISAILKWKITWKDIVIGKQYGEYKGPFRNTLLTIICYAIHKQWLKHSEDSEAYFKININAAVRNNIVYYNEIFKLTSINSIFKRQMNSVVENI